MLSKVNCIALGHSVKTISILEARSTKLFRKPLSPLNQATARHRYLTSQEIFGILPLTGKRLETGERRGKLTRV